MLTLLGTLFGGAFRMLPELFKMFDKKDERAHELAMFDRQLEADKLRASAALDQINAQADATLGAAEMQAIIEATKAQAVQTGVKWVDAVSALMRPIITFWWVIIMYTAALVAQYLVLVQQGASQLPALLSLWGEDEKAIVASIISFWFVDRSLRKR
jgi:hypothetical protein